MELGLREGAHPAPRAHDSLVRALEHRYQHSQASPVPFRAGRFASSSSHFGLFRQKEQEPDEEAAGGYIGAIQHRASILALQREEELRRDLVRFGRVGED